MRTLLGTRKYVLNSLRSQCITLQKHVSSIKNIGNCWQGPAIPSNTYGPLTGQKLQTGARLGAGSLGLRPHLTLVGLDRVSLLLELLWAAVWPHRCVCTKLPTQHTSQAMKTRQSPGLNRLWKL